MVRYWYIAAKLFLFLLVTLHQLHQHPILNVYYHVRKTIPVLLNKRTPVINGSIVLH